MPAGLVARWWLETLAAHRRTLAYNVPGVAYCAAQGLAASRGARARRQRLLAAKADCTVCLPARAHILLVVLAKHQARVAIWLRLLQAAACQVTARSYLLCPLPLRVVPLAPRVGFVVPPALRWGALHAQRTTLGCCCRVRHATG